MLIGVDGNKRLSPCLIDFTWVTDEFAPSLDYAKLERDIRVRCLRKLTSSIREYPEILRELDDALANDLTAKNDNYTPEVSKCIWAINKIKGPLVRQAFELYAEGRVNLELLADEMYRRGLTRKNGQKLDLNRLSELLNNRFYTGVIAIQKTGQQFVGAHAPLVPTQLFSQVQELLKGRFGRRTQKNSFLYSRLVKCKHCGKSLIGETKKGYLYYRCHTMTCPTTNISEQILNEYVSRLLELLRFSDEEKQDFSRQLAEISSDWEREKHNITQALQIRLSGIDSRLQRLTDAYIESLIDKETFEQRKTTLIVERQNTATELIHVEQGTSGFYVKRLSEYIALAERACLLFKNGNLEEKRQLLMLVTSERLVDHKTPMFMLHPVFQELANRQQNSGGGAPRAIHRDARRVIFRLKSIFKDDPDLLLVEANRF